MKNKNDSLTLHDYHSDANQASCFDLLNPEEKKLIESNSGEIDFGKGETILKQGAFASNILFLNEGLAKSYLEGNHRNLNLCFIIKGSFLGLQVLGDLSNKYPYSVTATMASRVTMIDVNIFNSY